MSNIKRFIVKTFFLLYLLFLSCTITLSQPDNLSFDLAAIGGYVSPGKMPFWLRSNHYGSIPLDNLSLSLIGSVHKDYDQSKKSLIDWGASIEGRANIGNKSDLILIEGYAKLRVSIFELRAGRSKEIMGLCDTSLSSGAFAVSGNALGIPKIQAGIPEFYTLPVLGRLFAFKGSFAHGWMGEIPMKLNDTIFPVQTFFHQKSLYGRFGKPEWKWKLYGGFNHQVFWGNERYYYGDIFTLSPLKTYLYVITGTPYGNSNIPRSKIGNHLGSIDVGLEYTFKGVRLFAYRQNIYDIGALYYLANIRDGLNGLSLENLKEAGTGFSWEKILVEVLYTKNQAGELWSPVTPSGDEDYYNNYQYVEGWSYKGLGLGNPFIGTRAYIKEELPNSPNDHFINNRVVAFHLGFEGSLDDWHLVIKTSYSLNYGTYGTSVEGHSLGTHRTPPGYGIFPETKQLSAYLEAGKEFGNGMNLGFIGAIDYGELYYDSFGLLLRISKSF